MKRHLGTACTRIALTTCGALLCLPLFAGAQEAPADWLRCTGELGPPRSAPPPARRAPTVALSNLVDSVAVVEGVRGILGGDPREACALFLLVVPREGVPLHLSEAFESDLEPEVLRRIEALLTDAIRPDAPRPTGAPDPLVARILVRVGSVPMIELGASYSTPPVMLNRTDIQRRLEEVPLAQPFQQSVVIRILAEVDGTVAQVVLAETDALLPVQEEVTRVARGMRFRPLQFDGVPARAWVQVPVNIGTGAPQGGG